MAHPCGTCLPCRHQRARVWAHRIQLEALQHEHNAFVTLTYDDKNLERVNGQLNIRDVTLFLKRIRASGRTFRYFYVGEYGPQTLRPHYHLAMFGIRTCLRGQTDLRKESCCALCTDFKNRWGNGAVQLARLEPASSAYIAGYVTKKLTAAPLPRHLTPEFHRMSLKPGLGFGVVDDIADQLLRHYPDIEDVPTALQHGKKKLPLGRYLRQNIRKRIGRSEKCPQTVLDKIKEQLRPLQESAFNNSTSFKKEVMTANQTRRLSFLQRKHIYRQGRSL